MNHENQPALQVSRSRPPGQSQMASSQGTNLADLLERVLDKGIVIAGDITLSLGTIELLTLRIRLVVASVDKAEEIGIDWWKSDPGLSSGARKQQLEARIERLEALLGDESQGDAVEGNKESLEQRLQRLETRAAPDAEETPTPADQASDSGT